MNKVSTLFGASIVSLASLASSASAQQQDFRCERDSLDTAQSIGRLDWAVNNAIPDNYGIPWDSAYRDDAIHEWDRHPVLRGRPTYPTYGVPAGNGIWRYPGDWRAPVDGSSRARVAAGYVQSMMCTSSCYRPEMRVLLAGGYLDIRSANQLAQYGMNEVVALAEGSTLDDLQFKVTALRSYTISAEEADHDIAVLRMEGGTVLKVTTNHTFLDGAGRVLDVLKFKVGDHILRADGTPEKIVSIANERYHGKVYNVTPDSNDLLNQVVVAEGYLTGSAYYQNVELNDANRHLLRRNLDPDGLR